MSSNQHEPLQIIAGIKAALQAANTPEVACDLIHCIVDQVEIDTFDETEGFGIVGRLITEGDWSVITPQEASDEQ